VVLEDETGGRGETHRSLSNLDKNGPRDVEGHQMTHCVPNDRRKIVS